MAEYTRINFTVSSTVDNEIKRAAKNKGLSVSEYCRQRLSENLEPEELNRITIESRLEKLEKSQSEIAETNYFLSRVLFYFIDQFDSQKAAEAWIKAQSELQKREG